MIISSRSSFVAATATVAATGGIPRTVYRLRCSGHRGWPVHPECGSVARTLPRKSSTGRLRIIDVVSHKQVRVAQFLFSQGITDHDPLRKDRRSRLGQLTIGTLPRNPPAAGMGVRLPDRLKARSRKEPKKRECRQRAAFCGGPCKPAARLVLGQERAWRPSHFSEGYAHKPLCSLNLGVASSRG